jgi:hypothetical protein
VKVIAVPVGCGDALSVVRPVRVKKAAELNVAVTLRAAVMLTVHVPVPVQAPLQPVKAEPVVGVAVRVTAVPSAYHVLQVLPHAMPVGDEVTVPEPVPAFVTVRSNPTWGVLRTAAIQRSESVPACTATSAPVAPGTSALEMS